MLILGSIDHVPGLNGDLLLANINFTTIGPPGSQSPLDITVIVLGNTVFDQIPVAQIPVAQLPVAQLPVAQLPVVASDGTITVK